MTSFFTRLRERRLVQWTLAYLAGAWLVVEVADVLGQWWGWPPGVVQGLLIFLGVGFFVALVVAWYHGEKGRQRVSGPELLIIALLLAIAGSLVALLGQRGRGGADLAAATDDGPAAAAPASAGTETGAASVAVLPFRDLSPAGDQEYFADGIAEEILTALTASRVSTWPPGPRRSATGTRTGASRRSAGSSAWRRSSRGASGPTVGGSRSPPSSSTRPRTGTSGPRATTGSWRTSSRSRRRSPGRSPEP